MKRNLINIFILLIMVFLSTLFAFWWNNILDQKFEEGKQIGIQIGYEKYQKENWIPKALSIKEYQEYPEKIRNRELQEKFKG